MRRTTSMTLASASLAAALVGGLLYVSQLATSKAAGNGTACTRLASSSGNDSAAGTPAAPWRTEEKLISSLQPGDVGCFAAGQTFGSVSREFDLMASNTTVQSQPGGPPATLVGQFVIVGSRNLVQNLNLDGHNTLVVPGNPATAQGQAGLFIIGDDNVVRGNNVSNGHTAICIEVGTPSRRSLRAVLDGNRVHGCGILPRTRHQHGIYVDNAQDMRITNNFFYDISDYGVHLYPHAYNTLVEANVIDTTGIGGVIIASESDGTPSSGNTIRRNIITNSGGPAVLTYWGGSPGSGNVAVDNCTSNNTFVQSSYSGLTVQSEKAVSSPGWDSNYMLRAGAACLGYGPASIQPGGTAPPPAPPPPPPAAPPRPPTPPPSPPRGGPATPVKPGGTTPTTTPRSNPSTPASPAAPVITSPAVVSGGEPTTKPGTNIKLFTYTMTWRGKSKKVYQLKVDKGRWFSVKGTKHTFKRLTAGKHKIAVRLKGSHGGGAKRVITIRG